MQSIVISVITQHLISISCRLNRDYKVAMDRDGKFIIDIRYEHTAAFILLLFMINNKPCINITTCIQINKGRPHIHSDLIN